MTEKKKEKIYLERIKHSLSVYVTIEQNRLKTVERKTGLSTDRKITPLKKVGTEAILHKKIARKSIFSWKTIFYSRATTCIQDLLYRSCT